MHETNAIIDPTIKLPPICEAISLNQIFGVAKFVTGNMMVCQRCRSVMHMDMINDLGKMRIAAAVLVKLLNLGMVDAPTLQRMIEEEGGRL